MTLKDVKRRLLTVMHQTFRFFPGPVTLYILVPI